MGQVFAAPKSADSMLDAVPFKVTNPQRIPAERYYDPAFFELERERLWPRVWQMACRLEEIPEVGDWVEYKILDQSVIVVRTAGGVKAFHNACRHRGVKLANGHGNCEVQGFNCPFHGWRWNIDGENTFVFARQVFDEENLDPAELNLVPCRVELWGGCAFINFDDDAPPLLETIQPLADRLDPRKVEKLRVEWWHSAILPTNWKLAMEAFMEGYHVMRTHPQLQEANPPLPGYDRYAPTPAGGPAPLPASVTVKKLIEMSINWNAVLSEGMAGMVHANDVAIMNDLKDRIELPDDPMAAMGVWHQALNAEITQQNRARGVDFPDLNDLPYASAVQFLFPHYFMLPLFGNMSAYRIRPLGPETCLFEIWSLVLYPEDEVRERPVAPTPMRHDDERFPPIPQQDYSNLPLQQEGLHAKGFEYMRLSKTVEGMISNYQRVIDGFLGGVDDDRLAKGIQVASGELDDPIKDIGF
ncbi:aromatic ring-hydroxylating dioxygenase subunit alpha [Phenylobacterium sp. LjRoot219]|uniref:aromatic ring-hydroxylating oxygenase subunit alpha n=1 Tax=Phenylobacterium sp. LjRoot219 TaxID=3342283 RepID=UPI003ED0E025